MSETPLSAHDHGNCELCDQIERELSVAQAKLAEYERPFPMMAKGPSIPWILAERIYRLYSKMYGSEQSLERLAKRGGFGWSEVDVIVSEFIQRYGQKEYERTIDAASQQKAKEKP